MSDELYRMKYKYERLLKDLNETLVKLENCYSNLILCKKKIVNCLVVDNNYYGHDEYEKIIRGIDDNIKIIKNIVIPEAKYEYNEILLKISRL